MNFTRNSLLLLLPRRSYTRNIILYSFLQVVLTEKYRMATHSNLLCPPENVLGITVLDKSLFEKPINIPCLNLTGVKLSSVLPKIKKYLLKVENFKPITNIAENEAVVYLNPEIVNRFSDFSAEDQTFLRESSISEQCLESRSYTLKYENYSAETILRSVLPKDKEGMSSFTKIGHIVHVNLREHLVPYKDVIGEVLFDKVPGCRTVVNKIDMIDNTYRNFQMEVLKGEDNMLTQVKENRCVFEFDFSKVYWNSRLCTEHERIVNMVKPGDVLFDVFAGVGPFSIPVAKKKCTVYSNDLNPESYKWLNHNAKFNKVDPKYFKSYNKDGREFILNEIKQFIPQHLNNESQIYITMNLPALAVEFLNAFIGLFQDDSLGEVANPPLVIVYCFAKGEDYMSITKELLFKNIGCDISDKVVDIFKVRTVSSLKEMMRITFRLDSDILTGLILKNDSRKRKCDNCDENMDKKRNHGEEEQENQQRV